MKKVLTLLIIVLFFNSCDDGELTVDNVNFGNAVPMKCSDSDVLYLKNENEVMILIIPEDQNAYANVVGTETFEINNENSVRYRLYNGPVGVDNVCAVLQPGTPQIIEEWIATSGTISIVTTAKYSTADPITGATTIVGYNHKIQFLNIVFSTSNGSIQKYSELPFGTYTTSTTSLTFNFNPDNVNQCNTNKTVYNVSEISNQESLIILNTSNTLINNTLGTKSEPIGLSTNQVIYQSYFSTLPLIPADYFCASPTPTLPLVNQKWVGVEGNVADGTGIIEVLTEEYNGGQFKHTIYFKNVTFYDATTNSTFFYGNNILYGYLITQ